MRKLMLAAICGTSVLLSGYTGCGEDLANDLKDDVEGQVKEAGTDCAALGASIESINVRASACYPAEEIAEWGFDVDEEDIAQCTQDYTGCSPSERSAVKEVASCLQSLSNCEDGAQVEFESEVEDCIAPLDEVFCLGESSDGDGSTSGDEAPAGTADAGTDDP